MRLTPGSLLPFGPVNDRSAAPRREAMRQVAETCLASAMAKMFLAAHTPR
ncbi:hypothetical protein GCM10010399_29800 [Dactylosporangium fulvum]|uniref:Uncharacterized protein n=1 Tax=Dactylosporangium fulvum TaxID=53359 RepID=A0ABY5W1H0_9ACTN|nr:hypothetical protein [Dactylosporangium fulvum]UWP83838.1 hypothetical protein Dfulv_06145 [Dactylosporangium fulvum]